MRSEIPRKVQIEFTPEFKRNLRVLSKKYPHIRSDVEPILGLLQSGEIVGDRVPGKGFTLFKVRVKNSDIQKGKIDMSPFQGFLSLAIKLVGALPRPEGHDPFRVCCAYFHEVETYYNRGQRPRKQKKQESILP